MSDRPRIGVSACLLGERVRYDGRDKREAWLVEVLGPRVEWVPVCPEVEAGLGTPREPMNLGRDASGRLVLMTDRVRDDLTLTMSQYCSRRAGELAAANLDGYVLKAGSPSCGLDISVANAGTERGMGLFATALTTQLVDLPITDERELANAQWHESFVDRVYAHFRRRTRR